MKVTSTAEMNNIALSLMSLFLSCFSPGELLPLVQVNRRHLLQSLLSDQEAPEVPKTQCEKITYSRGVK